MEKLKTIFGICCFLLFCGMIGFGLSQVIKQIHTVDGNIYVNDNEISQDYYKEVEKAYDENLARSTIRRAMEDNKITTREYIWIREQYYKEKKFEFNKKINQE